MEVNERPNAETPFVLIAKLRVKPDQVEEYLKIAQKADDAVRHSEPGMLLHTFDASPDDPCSFTWTEVYQNDVALIAHFNNPLLQPYLTEHDRLADGAINVTIYGNLAKETVQFLNQSGVPWRHHPSKLGFAANFEPRPLSASRA